MTEISLTECWICGKPFIKHSIVEWNQCCKESEKGGIRIKHLEGVIFD